MPLVRNHSKISIETDIWPQIYKNLLIIYQIVCTVIYMNWLKSL